jgi:ATP-dependent Clp protease ATP-binding subunit ClpB
VFNILLQVFDDGRLTDGQGRVVNFRNTIIIMTSNIASDVILEAENVDEIMPMIELQLKNHFRPEFLNRLDEVISFHRLEPGHMKRIFDLEMEKLRKRLAERRLSIVVSDEARDKVIGESYEPQFGARPLKRAVQSRIQNPLAKALLSGTFEPGMTVTVETDGEGNLIFVPR